MQRKLLYGPHPVSPSSSSITTHDKILEQSAVFHPTYSWQDQVLFAVTISRLHWHAACQSLLQVGSNPACSTGMLQLHSNEKMKSCSFPMLEFPAPAAPRQPGSFEHSSCTPLRLEETQLLYQTSNHFHFLFLAFPTLSFHFHGTLQFLVPSGIVYIHLLLSLCMVTCVFPAACVLLFSWGPQAKLRGCLSCLHFLPQQSPLLHMLK